MFALSKLVITPVPQPHEVNLARVSQMGCQNSSLRTIMSLLVTTTFVMMGLLWGHVAWSMSTKPGLEMVGMQANARTGADGAALLAVIPDKNVAAADTTWGQNALLGGLGLVALALGGGCALFWYRGVRRQHRPSLALETSTTLAVAIQPRQPPLGYGDEMLGAESYSALGGLGGVVEPVSSPDALKTVTDGGLTLAQFLAQGKDLYLLIQRAWDERDPELMRPRLTDTLFVRLSDQMARDEIRDDTEVIGLQARLLGRGFREASHADIEFVGLVREPQRGSATPFREIWSMLKNEQGEWLLDDIEELAV